MIANQHYLMLSSGKNLRRLTGHRRHSLRSRQHQHTRSSSHGEQEAASSESAALRGQPRPLPHPPARPQDRENEEEEGSEEEPEEDRVSKHPLRVPGMRPGESCFICQSAVHIAKNCPEKSHWEKNKAQLFRIAEHYLRSANLPVIRRTAITELAIFDAVNVENDIFEKSNSKLVYMNLYSQFISQLHKSSQSVGTDQAGKEDSSAVATDCSKVEETLKLAGHSGSLPSSPCRIVEGTEPETTGCSKVEEALKLAGLLDSPPNSRCRIEDTDEQAIENVLDIDSHPELDIYRDFEYDLEDEGYTAPLIVAGAFGVSRFHQIMETHG